MSDLAQALGVAGGIVCAVGAGGKKSLLYALAAEARGRVGLTATVHTAPFPRRLGAREFIGEQAALVEQLTGDASVLAGDGLTAYASPSDKPKRLAGLAPDTIANIHAQGGFGLTLVKADGARMRGIKAPKPGEPVLVPGTARVLTVVSAGVIGRVLDERVAHRPERLAEVLGVAPGARLTAEHIGRLLACERGGLQGTVGLPVVPVINQVDDDARLQQARVAAHAALAGSQRFDRVALTCLRRGQRWVEVVRYGN